MNQQETRQETAKTKQTDKLIKAIIALEKKMSDAAKPEKKNGGALGFLKDKLTGMKQGVKSAMSAKGVAGMLGYGEDTFIGGLATAHTESKAAKKEEQEKKLQMAADWARYSHEGQDEKDRDKAAADGLRIAEATLKINEEILALEKEQRDLKNRSPGLDLRDEDADRLKFLKDKVNQEGGMRISDIEPPKPVASVTPVEREKLTPARRVLPSDHMNEDDILHSSIAEHEAYQKNGAPLSQHIATWTKADENAIDDKSDSLRRTLLPKEEHQAVKDSREEIERKIAELDEKQLAALEAIAKNTSMSNEDKAEAASKAGLLDHFNGVKAAEGKAEAKKGFFGKMGDKLKGLVPGKGAAAEGGGIMDAVGSVVPKMLGGLAPYALPALGIAAAGAGGALIGHGINKAVEGLTGDSIGGHLHSWFGGADDEKGGKNDPTAPITISPERIAELKAKRAALTSPDAPGRVVQAQTLDKSNDQLEKTVADKKEDKPAQSATVINNVNNNTSNTAKTDVSPPVRNIDTAFNARLNAAFA